MPWFPDPAGGAPIQAATNPNPAGGTLGYYSDPGYSGPPPAGATPTGGAPSGATPTVQAQDSQQLASGINSLLGAIASGNKQAFDEAVRQFNQTFGLDQSKFEESVRQFNQNYLISQAGLTGTYQGQQTQQAQLQAANIAAQVAGLTGYYNAPGAATAGGGPTAEQYVAARAQQLQNMGFDPTRAVQTAQAEFAQGYAQQGNVAGGLPAGITFTAPGTAGGQGQQTLAGQLQQFNEQQALANLYGQAYANFGAVPGNATTLAAQQQAYAQQMGAVNAAAALQANPFRQAQVIGQAGRILQGMPTASFSAPNTVAGVGTAGGNTQGGMGYLSQLIDDIKNPTANQSTADSFLAQTPTPNKLDSASFLRSTPGTQNLILQAMQEKYGLDPNDSLTQIKNTLPQFAAPNTTGVVRRG